MQKTMNLEHISLENEEIKFIDELGSHSLNELSRIDLIRGYIDACKKRVNWCDMDRFKIMTHAYEALKNEESNYGKNTANGS